mgnify:CR=1 FL=1
MDLAIAKEALIEAFPIIAPTEEDATTAESGTEAINTSTTSTTNKTTSEATETTAAPAAKKPATKKKKTTRKANFVRYTLLIYIYYTQLSVSLTLFCRHN